ncbi:hypothetical protein [Agaribacterium haliotis]|uniref:hypothetical protein n=1 Tax=Agaribacterium haliotis TaxID=2013869 RepID=UPI000BB57231|nr:hypothetical protein [Agaribacterium haliotis]
MKYALLTSSVFICVLSACGGSSGSQDSASESRQIETAAALASPSPSPEPSDSAQPLDVSEANGASRAENDAAPLTQSLKADKDFLFQSSSDLHVRFDLHRLGLIDEHSTVFLSICVAGDGAASCLFRGRVTPRDFSRRFTLINSYQELTATVFYGSGAIQLATTSWQRSMGSDWSIAL